MNESKHTPEPWAVKGAAIRTADGIGIDVIATMQVSNQPFWDEDARRIVACVNACAGMTNEQIDNVCMISGSLLNRFGEQMAYLGQVEKQRDELLAAIEAMAINSEECLDFDECTAMLVSIEDYHKLMETAARAKGEQ